MRVLWLSRFAPYPPDGVVRQRSYHLLRELARHNDVDVMAFFRHDLFAQGFSSIEQGLQEAHAALSEFCRTAAFFPIPCERHRYAKHALALASLATPVPYAINCLRSGSFRAALHARAAHSYDVIHMDAIGLAPHADALPRIPRVFDHHNIESHMMIRRAGIDRNWLKKLYFLQEGVKLRNYERLMYPRFSLHLACSERDSRQLRAVSPNIRVENIPTGIDVDYFRPRGGEEIRHRLLSTGHLNAYPDRDAMTRFAAAVWPRLKAAIPGISMDVVGGSMPDSLLALSKRDENFRVHGLVDDLRPYFERASVYVCPTSDGDGTGRKVLNAFAMAKPVVSDPAACEGIAVQEGLHILLARDPEQWVSHIRALFADDELRRVLGQAARELVLAQYSHRATGLKLRRAYDGLASAAQ